MLLPVVLLGKWWWQDSCLTKWYSSGRFWILRGNVASSYWTINVISERDGGLEEGSWRASVWWVQGLYQKVYDAEICTKIVDGKIQVWSVWCWVCDTFLSIIGDMLPKENKLPASTYYAKKLISPLWVSRISMRVGIIVSYITVMNTRT